MQVDRGVSGLLSYPFSRAQRVEVSAGLRQIGLKQDVTIARLDLSGYQLSQDETTSVRSRRSTWRKPPRRSSTTRRSPG